MPHPTPPRRRPSVHLFTYGTLVFPEVMTAVAGRAFASVPATLSGFARCCVRDAVYPGACVSADASIAGALYLDVDDAALARLDRFEGEMYERRTVRVLREDGAEVEAETYVVPSNHAGRLDPAPWDLERFRRDHLASYLERCRAGWVADDADR